MPLLEVHNKMAFALKFTLPLLFGIIIPRTVAMTTVIKILVPTGKWKELTVQLLEKDDFGCSITGLSREALVTALELEVSIDHPELRSFLKEKIQDNTIQLQVEGFNTDNKTIKVVPTFYSEKDEHGEYVGVYAFDFKYDFPTITIQYNRLIGWDGVYNSQTSEMKLIRPNHEKGDLDHLLKQLKIEKYWQGNLSIPEQGALKMLLKEPTPVGLPAQNIRFTSLILALNRLVKIHTSTSEKEIEGYVFQTLGRIELLVNTEQLDDVRANIQNSFWGYYYTDNEKKLKTIHFTAIGGTENAVRSDEKYLVVNYVQTVRMYNDSRSVDIKGLRTDVDGEIKMIDTEINLKNLQDLSESTNEAWYLDMGVNGVNNIATFQASAPPVPITGELYSFIVNYTYK